jgi:hypothetical protein
MKLATNYQRFSIFKNPTFRILLFNLITKNKLRAHVTKFFMLNPEFKSLTREQMIEAYESGQEPELLKKFCSSTIKLEGSKGKLAQAQNMCKALIDHFGFMTAFTTITFP